jgi:hypothetical protein
VAKEIDREAFLSEAKTQRHANDFAIYAVILFQRLVQYSIL